MYTPLGSPYLAASSSVTFCPVIPQYMIPCSLIIVSICALRSDIPMNFVLVSVEALDTPTTFPSELNNMAKPPAVMLTLVSKTS